MTVDQYPHLLSPLEVGPLRAAQPRGLDLAPDQPGPRPPAHPRSARLPRGPGARRRRRDLPRGHRGPRQRSAHRPHDRRLPGRDRARLPRARRPDPRARLPPVGAAVSRRPRADLELAQGPGGGAVGDPEPAFQERAAGADRPRDPSPDRRLRDRRPLRRRGRGGRGRGLDLPRLSPGPVPVGAVQPPWRWLRRFAAGPAALLARGPAGGARAGRRSDGRRRAAVGRRAGPRRARFGGRGRDRRWP